MLLSPSTAAADNSVNISNNGDGANSNISIHNEVNSNTQSNSTSETHTSVRIESNGSVKSYDSDKPENVDMQSDDGHTQVHISNSISGSQNDSTQTHPQNENTQNNSNSADVVISTAPKNEQPVQKPVKHILTSHKKEAVFNFLQILRDKLNSIRDLLKNLHL